jgi:hypothetical protein
MITNKFQPQLPALIAMLLGSSTSPLGCHLLLCPCFTLLQSTCPALAVVLSVMLRKGLDTPRTLQASTPESVTLPSWGT